MSKIVKESLITEARRPAIKNVKLLSNSLKNHSPSGVRKAIEKGVPADWKRSIALDYAVLWRDRELIDYLIDNGAKISAREYRPLKVAYESDSLDILEYMINKYRYQLDPDAMEELEEDIPRQQLDMIFRGPSEEQIKKKLEKEELTPNEKLVFSARTDFFAGVEEALEQGANIHYYDDAALIQAAKNGHLAIVDYLVENGADVTAEYNEAYRKAAENGHDDVVQYLLENGADIKALRFTGIISAIRKNNVDVIYAMYNSGEWKKVPLKVWNKAYELAEQRHPQSNLKDVVYDLFINNDYYEKFHPRER